MPDFPMRTFPLVIVSLLVLALPQASGIHAQVLSEEYLRIGASYGSNIGGDEITYGFGDYSMQPYNEIFIDMHLVDHFGIRLSGFWGKLSNQTTSLRDAKDYRLSFDAFSYSSLFVGGMIGPAYTFDPLFLEIQPTLFISAGVVRRQTTYTIEQTEYRENWKPVFSYAFGAMIDIPVFRNVSLNLTYTANFVNTDRLDGFRYGYKDDGFSTVSAGFSVFLRGGNEEELPLRDPFLVQDSIARDESLVSETSSPYSEERKVNWELEADRAFMRNADLVVESNEFTSFNALQRNPRDLRIRSKQNQPFPTSLKANVEFLHRGQVIARGAKQTLLPRGTKEINASHIIDFDSRNIEPEYRSQLPKGNYLVRLSLQSGDQPELLSEAKVFQILKLNEVYKDSAYKLNQFIENQQLEALFTDDNKMIMSTFALNSPFIRNTSAVNEEIWKRGRLGANTEDAPFSEVPVEARDAATIVPKGMTERQAETYLRSTITQAFNTAARIKRMSPRGESPPIIIAELFFAFDDASLSRENQIMLDQAMKELNSSTEFNLELRGYADDVGETSYNLILSRTRALNVRDYLVRGVASRRLRWEGYGKLRYIPIESMEWRQRARKVEVLLVD